MSLFDVLGAAQNGANSSQAYTGASNTVRGEAGDALNTLNAGRDAALSYLGTPTGVGNAAINQNANVLGLTGGSWGSSAGIVRTDPTNIGTTPFSFDPSTVNVNSDPGYAFAQQQALGAVGQGAYAAGKGLSGAATVAAEQRAGDVANQYFNQDYTRDFNTALTTNTTNNALAQQNYTNTNNQFLDFENRLGTAAGHGQSADTSAAGVQTGTSALAAANDTATGNTLANLVLGKAAAGNAANTQLLSSISGTATDAVKGYLGLS